MGKAQGTSTRAQDWHNSLKSIIFADWFLPAEGGKIFKSAILNSDIRNQKSEISMGVFGFDSIDL